MGQLPDLEMNYSKGGEDPNVPTDDAYIRAHPL